MNLSYLRKHPRINWAIYVPLLKTNASFLFTPKFYTHGYINLSDVLEGLTKEAEIGFRYPQHSHLSVKPTSSRVAHETSYLGKTSKTFRKSNCSIEHPAVRYQSHSILNHWTDDGQNFDVLFCLTSSNKWTRAFITLTHSILDGLGLSSSFIRFSDEIQLQITRRFSKTHHPILNISSVS